MAGQTKDRGSSPGTGKQTYLCHKTPTKPRTEWELVGIYTVVKREAGHLPPCSTMVKNKRSRTSILF
jgi:hypothetical protein